MIDQMLFYFTNPLDLEEILVYHLAGNLEVFIYLSLFFIASMAGIFRMRGDVFAIMMLVFILIFMRPTIIGGGGEQFRFMAAVFLAIFGYSLIRIFLERR